jgi:hypothetical protein
MRLTYYSRLPDITDESLARVGELQGWLIQ